MTLEFLIVYLLTLYSLSAQKSYPFESWMNDFPSSLDFYNNTIFDIVLPGSRASGMVHQDISDIVSNNAPISSLPLKDQKAWNARQQSSVLNQLRSGARFLDLQIEQYNTNYYAYNGLLALSITSIIDDINTFIQNYGQKEIIIIYLSSFHGTDSQSLYDIFTASNLNQYMVPNDGNITLTTTTLQSIVNAGYNIIALSDDVSNAPNTFFDSSTYLHIETTSSASNLTLGTMDKVHQVRTFVTSNIRNGWPSDKLNIIYWTLDTPSDTHHLIYDSFRQYNVPMAFELKRVISSYRKLRFGNVLLVDFIASSDVVEQSILLNSEYSQCKDLIWNDESSGCPAITSLQTYFKYSESSECNALHAKTNCPRSCGLCPIPQDVPGSYCSSSAECSSPLYTAYGSSASGSCFVDGPSSPFCLGLNPSDSCGNFDTAQRLCGNDSDFMADLVSQCDSHCSAHYQCTDGYCNGEWGICMTLNDPNVTTTMDIFGGMNANDDIPRYNAITSDSASKYRSDINVFRPGDSEADYPEDEDAIQCLEYNTECFIENLNANPYVTSVLGLILLVIILSILLCICFSICAPFWCLCDKGCKRCCCRPIYGKRERENWSMCKRWSSCICLIMVMVIITAFAIEGIIFNSKLWSHIFDSTDDDSFVSVSNALFDDVESKFSSAHNLSAFVTDNIDSVLQSVDDVVNDDNTNDVRNSINEMHHLLTSMASDYEFGISLSNTVINPFTLQNNNFTLHCEYCDTIHDTIIDVNDTLEEESSGTLDDIMSVLDESAELKNATAEITDALHEFDSSVDKILDISTDTRLEYNDYIEKAERYNGEIYVTLTFLSIIVIFIVLPLIGAGLRSKWCFKMNWCLAMCCSIILLLISIPFIFTLTLSADFCVRLDEFEDALPTMDSRLARDVLNNSVLNDDFMIDYNARDTLNIIDTCFDGGSILDVFNLSDTLDYNIYRSQLDFVLNIDMASDFYIESLETLQSDINTLSTEEYTSEVDELIFYANSINGCQCVDDGVQFDRSNLNPGTDCTVDYTGSNNVVSYWNNTLWTERDECKDAFINASYAVQTENQSLPFAQNKMDALKADSNAVFAIYDSVLDRSDVMIAQIHSITCLVNPLFKEFDEILNDFANCGFMGELYGNFKNVGCIVIFNDFYRIGRAIVIIAFMCLLIILWSLCLDYVYDPIVEKFEPRKRKQSQSDFADAYDDGIEIECVSPKSLTPNISTNYTNGSIASLDDYEAEGADQLTIPDNVPVALRVMSNSNDNIDVAPHHNDTDTDSDNDVVNEMDGRRVTSYQEEDVDVVDNDVVDDMDNVTGYQQAVDNDDEDEYPVVPGGDIVEESDPVDGDLNEEFKKYFYEQ